MNKNYIYLLILTLLVIVVWNPIWQNVILFSLLLGYSIFKEYLEKKEEVRLHENKIKLLEEHIVILSDKVNEVRTKLGILGMTKNIQGK